MLGWLKKRAAAKFLKGDNQRTIEAISRLPREQQHRIATDLCREISFAEQSVAKVARGAPELVSRATQMVVMRARNRRHAALTSGATSWDSEDWASSALFEGWAMGLSGLLGRSVNPAIQGPVKRYIEATLTPSEIAEIQSAMAKENPIAHGLKDLGS